MNSAAVHLGLPSAQRLQQYGANTLQTVNRVPWYVVLVRQFIDVLILILLVAAAISLVAGEFTDAMVILIILVLNGALGFVQEWRAEKAHALGQPERLLLRAGSNRR